MPKRSSIKIVPHLWYIKEAKEAARFYVKLSRNPASTGSGGWPALRRGQSSASSSGCLASRSSP